VRTRGTRTKKLIVAFHFQFANQAAWKCDECRRQGLEKLRRCGWLNWANEPRRVVWARGGVATECCPTSYVTADSAIYIQEFNAWKLFGGSGVYSLPARTVDAFIVLEHELRSEMRRAQE